LPRRIQVLIFENIIMTFSSCLLVLILLFAGLWISTSDNILYQLFSDRDLWRASTAFVTFPHLGPEHTGEGHRVPGGFYYYFLWVWLQISNSVDFINLVLISMFTGSAVLLLAMTYRYCGWLPAIITTAFYISVGFLPSVILPWNPGFLPLFVVAGYYLYLRLAIDSHSASFPPLMLVLSLAMQFHSQVGLLLVVFLLGLAIKRVQLGWKHLMLGLLLFSLPLAHYVFVEASSGWANTQLMTRPYDGAPVLHSGMLSVGFITSTANFLYQSLAQILADSGQYLAPPFQDKYTLISNLLSATDYLVVASVSIMVILLAVRPLIKIGPELGRGGTVFIHMVFVLLLYSLLYSLARKGVVAKHLVAAVPAAAVIAGISFASVIDWLTASRSFDFRFILALCVMGLLGMRFTAPAVLLATQKDAPINAVHADMTEHLKKNFYPDREAFENRTFDPRNLTDSRLQNDYGRISFFHKIAGPSELKTSSDLCTIAIRKQDWAGETVEQLYYQTFDLKEISRLNPRLLHQSQSQHHIYQHYQTPSGNCLSSFANSYLPTRLELRLQNELNTLPLQKNSVRLVRDDGMRWFIVRTGANRPSVILEFMRRDAQLLVTLRGKGLRGPSGLSGKAGPIQIDQPKLVFKNVASGRILSVLLFEGVIGSFREGTLGPWRSVPIELTEGTFEIRFQGVELNRNGRTFGEPWDLPLTDDFQWHRE